ncbi:hypothetical protein P7C71_g6600, partial [Lecanoromycetidae sp. Uapishka_2]
MESMNYTTPGIASILETLRAYTPSNNHPQQYSNYAPTQGLYDSNVPLQTEAGGDDDLEEGEYDPMSYDPTQPLPTTYPPPDPPHQIPFTTRPELQPFTPQQVLQQNPSHIQQQPAPQKPAQPAPKKTYQTPAYSPATITTWPPALRHITSLAANNLEFIHRIRHLITTQHTHERQWHSSRLTLVQKLSARGDSRSKLDSVLGSLGGNVTKNGGEKELSVDEELKIYDKKVHQACQEMEAACIKELRKLEVPFFCTMRGLVTEKGEAGKQIEKKKGTIREEELAVLMGRMLQLLEDLCGGEE